MDETVFATAVEAIYEAGVNPDGWPRALELLSDLFGSGPAALLYQNQTTLGGSGATVRLDPSALVDYYRYYGAINPLLARNPTAMRRFHADPALPLPVTLDGQVISKSELMQTEYYNDFAKTNGMYSSLMITAAIEGQNAATINIMRHRDSADFDQNDVLLARRLQPHLIRAVQISLRLSKSARGGETLSRMMERSAQGLFVIDDAGLVQQANPAGLAMLGDGLSIVQGELTAAAADPARLLRKLIAETADRWNERRGGALSLPRPSLRRPYAVIVSPLGSASELLATGPSVLVTVTDPDAAPPPDAAVLEQLFGLSPAEVRVCERLVAGDSPQQVAEGLGISVSTVRWHLASLYRKTGTNRQPELVRLLLSLPNA